MGKIQRAIWLSYDLGIGGDYPGLYKWLDNHNAIECGNSVAFFRYEIENNELAHLTEMLSEELRKAINLRAGDRLYIIHKESAASGQIIKGTFICGRRKSNPWEGYGDNESIPDEDGE